MSIFTGKFSLSYFAAVKLFLTHSLPYGSMFGIAINAAVNAKIAACDTAAQDAANFSTYSLYFISSIFIFSSYSHHAVNFPIAAVAALSTSGLATVIPPNGTPTNAYATFNTDSSPDLSIVYLYKLYSDIS